ncbi:hypothetical protein PACTADRAFT_52087 [Pachysolen tannophilus NRRL Y-2460]|uniref:Uncharacterized protein n=1 Tax=Pachysolen tannophilus NRRL Y-2460 TaxID=669874 RepID=A0A1E4TP49_PACTA|nr:hypothetical protein PACTADRAFT_52087 [Pachysolen tannophilus NRRL Y-2460]
MSKESGSKSSAVDVEVNEAGEFFYSSSVNSNSSKSFLHRIDKVLRLQDEDQQIRHSNPDLDPLPPHRRTWRGWQLACYWGSDMLQASALRTVVSYTELGLNTRMSLLSIAIGYLIVGIILTFNGRFGVQYHVPFAVQGRASYGYYFSYLMVLLRLIVGGIWYATNVYTGAECVRSMIYACWPSFHDVPNHLPTSANIDTQLMTAYVIYFIISLPFHYIRQEKIQWIFTLKTVLVPGAFFAVLGWSLASATDVSEIWEGDNSVHGSEFSWVFINCLSSSISSYATLAVNVNDFTRYTDDKKAPYIQIFVLPIFVIFTSCVGLTMAVASEQLWGSALWDPLLVFDNWTSKGGRAASFFLSLIFLFAQIGVNLSANCASAANDLNALLPRYINIRRGQFIIAFVFAWGATPWNILYGASSFINFMDGYSIFLGPMAAIVTFDYYLVHGLKYDIREFYKTNGIYRYNKFGINWRAAIAFLCGFAPQLPGFAASVNSSIVLNENVLHFYYIGYFFNFPVTGIVYTVLSKLFPAKETILQEAVTPDNIDFKREMSHSENPIYPEGFPEEEDFPEQFNGEEKILNA